MTGKMAIVGSGESITVFRAAGVAAFHAEDEKRARDVIRRAAQEYAIIFVTEEIYRPLADFLKRFDESPYPVILPIGKEGFGEEFIKSAMERALGADIFANNGN